MKTITLYLVLVGIPFLGLLGILRIGETLTVPVSIGGTWAVDEAAARDSERSCAVLALPRTDAKMTISQSGRFVQVQFNDPARTVMTGRIRDRTLTVRQVLPSAEHVHRACGETTMVLLQAMHHRTPDQPDRLAGEWTTPDCDTCPVTPFGAVRHSAP